jgi:hypothetical protein
MQRLPASAFLTDAPGVVTGTVIPAGGLARTLVGQYHRAPDEPSLGAYDLTATETRLLIAQTGNADIERGDLYSTGTRSYRITAVTDDGHGQLTLTLEPN